MLDAAELYVTSWLATWVASFVLAALFCDSDTELAFWVVATIAVYRMIDMALYEIQVLLTMEPSPLRSVPRAILLRVGNLGEVGLATAALVLLRSEVPASAAALTGYRTVTLQADFGHPGLVADLVVVAAGATALLLLVGGIAMLLGKVAETFHEN